MPTHWQLMYRLIPMYICTLGGTYIDMKRVERSCDEEQSMCNEIIKAHRMMIASGHPPFPELNRTWSTYDPYSELRKPPIILKREFIENWDLTNVVYPKDEQQLFPKIKTSSKPVNDENLSDTITKKKNYSIMNIFGWSQKTNKQEITVNPKQNVNTTENTS